MKKNNSHFKDLNQDQQALKRWIQALEQTNGYHYEKRLVKTSLGTTQVYGLNTHDPSLETIVLFPGFRTTALIWDLDQGLAPLAKRFRVFLVETNGQPNLSEGHSPSIHSLDYGIWAAEVLEQLEVRTTYIAGASFGGLVCLKLALVAPAKIKGAFLLNPGCFRRISLGFKNLYYNLLPIIRTTEANLRAFLNQVVFYPPNHQLSEDGTQKLVTYLQLAIVRYKDRTEKPYYMGEQLNAVSVATYLLVGKNDILLPPALSIKNAKKHLRAHLKEVVEFEGVGHGIECYPPAIQYIVQTMEQLA